MEGDLIAAHGDFRIVQGKYPSFFSVYCRREGKQKFWIIFEQGKLSTFRDGGKLEAWLPHVATWAEKTLLAHTNAVSLESPKGTQNVIAA